MNRLSWFYSILVLNTCWIVVMLGSPIMTGKTDFAAATFFFVAAWYAEWRYRVGDIWDVKESSQKKG